VGVCDVIQNGRRLGCHLGFCPKLELINKRRKVKIFDVGNVENDTIKHFASFTFCVFLSPKKGENTRIFLQNGVTTCHS